jgi:hypothetical protein
MRLRNYPLKGPEGEPGEYPRNPRALLSIISLAFACDCPLEQFPLGFEPRGFRPQKSGSKGLRKQTNEDAGSRTRGSCAQNVNQTCPLSQLPAVTRNVLTC